MHLTSALPLLILFALPSSESAREPGRDRPNILFVMSDDWRTAVYYRYWMHMAHGHANPAHFGLRTERHKLILYYGADYTGVHAGREITRHGGNRFGPSTPIAWELYDLERDPLEMRNRHGDPEYAEIATELKQQLRDLRAEIGDTDERFPHLRERYAPLYQD